MQRVYVALDPETIKALVHLAKANRRHPKHEGGLIITRYLQEQGLLSRHGQTPDAVTLGEGAVSGADQQPPTSGGGAT
jgi:hypothetical protein